MTVLVGDAGGTNVRFALARRENGVIRVTHVWKRRGADFATFDAALDAFRAEIPEMIQGAAFGVAGAVKDGRVSLLHRQWSLDRRDLANKLGVQDVVLVNDFFAMARAAPELGSAELVPIAPGQADPQGSIAVGGPGTGFGIGALRRYRDGWIVVAGEGGHQAYGPQTPLEWEVAKALRKEGLYVSNEVVASGSGFDETRAALASVMGLADPATTQSEVIAAAEQGDAFSLEFCRLRARTVMTVLGNLALSSLATGGVYLAGGVTQRLVPWLKEKSALDRFYARGPRTELLSYFPIQLITGEDAPLKGAMHLWLDQKARGWL